MRHPTLLTPRDFDLSPYFDVIKFNQLAEGGFDYRNIRWICDEAPLDVEPADANARDRPVLEPAREAGAGGDC
jgi:hypothetical protein